MQILAEISTNSNNEFGSVTEIQCSPSAIECTKTVENFWTSNTVLSKSVSNRRNVSLQQVISKFSNLVTRF